MRHQDIIDRVARGAQLPTRRSAEHALRAVLETLSVRVDEASVTRLAENLPLETAVYLHDIPATTVRAPRDVDAFLDRVAGRLALTRPDAIRITQAVISVLSLAAGEEPIRLIREQLPFEWRVVFEPRRYYAPPPPPPPPAV